MALRSLPGPILPSPVNPGSESKRRALEKGLVCEDNRELSPEFARTVEGLTSGIKDPVERLRFLRGSTRSVRQLEEQIPKVPKVARPLVYKYLGWRGLSLLKGEGAAGVRAAARGKIAALQVAVALCGGALVLGASYGTIRLASSLSRKTPTVEARVLPQPLPVVATMGVCVNATNPAWWMAASKKPQASPQLSCT